MHPHSLRWTGGQHLNFTEADKGSACPEGAARSRGVENGPLEHGGQRQAATAEARPRVWGGRDLWQLLNWMRQGHPDRTQEGVLCT